MRQAKFTETQIESILNEADAVPSTGSCGNTVSGSEFGVRHDY